MPLGVATDLLETLIEQTDQVVFVYDTSAGKFTYLNPAFEKVWRKKRKGIMEHPASLLKTIHPEDQQHVREAYQELLEGVIIHETEFRIKLRNHTERWICVKPLLQEEQSAIMGYASDITDHKEYINYLKKYSSKKNSILHILSHDLAGPLGMISNIADLLHSDLKSHQNPDIQNLIGLIQKSSQQGLQLIKEFLKQELLESSEIELVRSRIDLVQRIRECIKEYQQSEQITHKVFHFYTSCEQLYLELDDTKFLQAINNLISNSIKFTPDGGEISVTLEEKEATVSISVADNGIGIPAKHHATLFDKFTRARRPGIKGEPTVGLGMSIVRTIVEWHHGHIWFESQENKGTTFYIEIPKNN